MDERENRHLRTYLRVAPPPRVEGRLDLSDITIADLLAAAEGIFAEEAEKQALGTVISAPRITIREKIAWIAERLNREPHTTFNNLMEDKPTRLEIVVTFLALLELVKRYRVSARQEDCSQISRSIRWRIGDKTKTWKLNSSNPNSVLNLNHSKGEIYDHGK